MHTFTIQGKAVTVFAAAQPNAPAIFLHCFTGEEQTLLDAARAAGCPPFSLVTVSGLDWNHDLAPWAGPAAFKNGAPFTGGAAAHLQLLTQEILPRAQAALPGTPAWRGIAGYSLAGLFALYAVYQTSLFARVGCVSASLWFPGFKEYAFAHEPIRWPDCIYFSLGDKEARTRNPLLKTVQTDTEQLHAFYAGKGIDTVLRQNPGNHFAHQAQRTADCIHWLLGRPAAGGGAQPL